MTEADRRKCPPLLGQEFIIKEMDSGRGTVWKDISGPIPLHTSTEGFSLGKSRGELNRDMMMGLIETLGQKLSRGGWGGDCTTVKWLNALGRRASDSSHLWPNLHLVFCEPCFELADLQKVSYLLRSAS